MRRSCLATGWCMIRGGRRCSASSTWLRRGTLLGCSRIRGTLGIDLRPRFSYAKRKSDRGGRVLGDINTSRRTRPRFDLADRSVPASDCPTGPPTIAEAFRVLRSGSDSSCAPSRRGIGVVHARSVAQCTRTRTSARASRRRSSALHALTRSELPPMLSTTVNDCRAHGITLVSVPVRSATHVPGNQYLRRYRSSPLRGGEQ